MKFILDDELIKHWHEIADVFYIKDVVALTNIPEKRLYQQLCRMKELGIVDHQVSSGSYKWFKKYPNLVDWWKAIENGGL